MTAPPPLNLDDFDFDLPPALIATEPAARRDQSRLLRLDRAGGRLSHHSFGDLPGLLRPGDCLVLNDSRVMPARFYAQRPTGGRVEVLLLKERDGNLWEAIVRPARKLKPGDVLDLPGEARLEIGDALSDRARLIRYDGALPLEQFLERHGEMPLPPYILQRRREAEIPLASPADRERYQTVYARRAGSSAAPTAGLHFTSELLDRLRRDGISVLTITLHVGLGTFAPLDEASITNRTLHPEWFEIAEDTAAQLEQARNDAGRRIIAVGTTSVRALEQTMRTHGRLQPGAAETRLFIQPGDRFQAVDALITNFHLPRSSLLMLVAAFTGTGAIRHAYRTAVQEGYRFYSYGDAMLIE